MDYQDRAKRRDEKRLEFVWQGSKTLGSSAQANVTHTNHVMWTMRTDFKCQYAQTWFRQMDKLIHYVNMDGRVNALYSTPSIYADAKHATNEAWTLKTDDFFPYGDRANGYWTGYFTSRPAFKHYVRFLSGYYLHHDAITGTEKQHVADDYTKRLSMGYMEAEELVASSLASLVVSTKNGTMKPTIELKQCPLLNISYCPPSEVDLAPGKSLVVVVYNSLGWKRNDVARIPVGC